MSCISFILLSVLFAASQSRSHAARSTEVFDHNVRTFYKNFYYSSQPSDDHSTSRRHGNGEWSHFTSQFVTVPIPVPISYNAQFWKFWLENYSNQLQSILKEQQNPIYQYEIELKKPRKPAHTKQNYNILIRANVNENEENKLNKKAQSPTLTLTNAEKKAIQKVLKDYTQNEIVRLLQTQFRSKNHEKGSKEKIKRKRRSSLTEKDEQTKEALGKINEICDFEVSKTEEKTDNGIETIDGVEYAVFKGVFMEEPDIDYYKVGIDTDVPKNANAEIKKPPADKKKSRKKRTMALLSKHLRKNQNRNENLKRRRRRRRRSPEEKDKAFKADLKRVCRAATSTTIEERPDGGTLIETIDGVDYAVFQGVYLEDPDLDFYKIGVVETGSKKSKNQKETEKKEEPQAPKEAENPSPTPAPESVPEPTSAPVEATEKPNEVTVTSTPTPEAPHPETPAPEAPSTEAQTPETQTSEAQTPEAQTPDVQTPEAQNSEAPITEAPPAEAHETSTTPHPEEAEKPTEPTPLAHNNNNNNEETTTEHEEKEAETTEAPKHPEKKGKVAQEVENKEETATPKPKGFAALFACPGPRCRGGKKDAPKDNIDKIVDLSKKGKAALEAEVKSTKQSKTTPAPVKSKLPVLPHGASHSTSKIYNLHEEELHYDDEGDHTPKKKKKKPGPEKPKKRLLNPFAKFG